MTTPAPTGELRMVPVDQIRVPELRVTAQYDDSLAEELVESVGKQGVLVPLLLLDINGELWLADGRNRLRAALANDLPEVPCTIKPGTTRELITQNLTTSRAKGKSNPAEEAKVIRALVDDEEMPIEKVAGRIGISRDVARKLYDISFLPQEVLAMVAAGRLGSGHAEQLLKLPVPALQVEVAQQAVEWRYTVDQVRLRVDTLLRPQAQPVPGGLTFGQDGAPARIPIPCYLCHVDLTGGVNYIYVCGACQQLVDAFWREYNTPPSPAPAPVSPAPAPPPAPAQAEAQPGP